MCAGNKLTVSGTPCITGNLGKDGAANNVYLGRREIIHVDGALESGASIGVTTADPVIDGSYVRVADGTELAADTTSYFTSDAYPGCTKRLMGDSVIFSSGTLHEHAVCGRSDCTDAAHGNTAWIPLTSVDGKLLYGGANASKNGDSYMLYAGNYYLAADIELDGRLFLAGDVNLCLNGKQITTTNTSVSAVVDDHWGLTLCDCRGSGRISAPGETVNGVSSSQSFTMYGGTISGGRYGAYIYDDHGAFRMLGGKITGSQTGIYRNSSRNSLTIGGDANVTGSTRNVYLDSGVLTIDPSLTQAARIGITTSRQPTDDVPVQFAAGASNTALDYTKIFLPDASGQGYVVMPEQDKLYLRKHQHSWAYTASGTTITAACTNADGTCPDTNGGSVTLSAPDQTLFYNGMARAASCTSSLTTGDAAIITYYAKPADTTALSGAPVNAGDYIARIQLGEASVSVSYTIEKVRLLVTANSTVIDYGTAPMHDGVSCQGFVNNEDIDDLDGTPTYAHTYRQFADVGEYTITPGGLTSDNYDISFLPGTLEVRPRTVTLTWHNTEGRIYADDEGAITATVSNAVNGDRIGVTVTGGELTVGTHTAAATGLTGDKAKNYQLSTVDADRTVQYTVAQAAQALTFAQQGSLTRTYGDDAFSNAASNNRRDGGSITYASSRESVATVASDGTVTIHAAGEATITATAAETANYQQSAASYTLRVSPKGVTITGLQAESKTYDGTAAAVITGTPALSGLMAGDDVTVDAARAAAAFADADAGTGKTVLLSGYALTGADAANYTLIAQPTGITADITKAAITVTPDAGQGKTYGEKDPALTYTLAGAVNGETPAFRGVLARDAGANAGSYAITGGNLALADGSGFKADNYTLKLADEVVYFTIRRAAYGDRTVNGSAMYDNNGTVDLSSLIAEGGTAVLGSVTDDAGVLNGTCSISEGILRFGFADDASKVGKTAKVKVNVTGADNYEDYTITVTLKVEAKLTPSPEGALTLSPAEITYGEKLGAIAISGTMQADGRTVAGTFTWQEPDTVLDAGTHAGAAWKFMPDDTKTYVEATGTVTVQVNRAAQSAAVSMAGFTYNDAPSAPSLTYQVGDGRAVYYYGTENTASGGTKWENMQPTTLDAGTYYMYAVIGETDNYREFTTAAVQFVVEKATPTYKKPTGVTAKYGQTLGDIALATPEGTTPGTWSWQTPQTVLDKIGSHTYDANFKPDDPNYKGVVGAAIDVTVGPADGRNLRTVELVQKYTDTEKHTYAPDWSSLPEGQRWTFSSEASEVLLRQDFAADGSLLTYAIPEGKALGDQITITLKASCANYEDFTITLHILLREKDNQAALRVTGGTTVVYGETLQLGSSGGSGTGKAAYAVTNGTGEAVIDPDTGLLTPVKVGIVTVTVTKAEDKDYKEAVSDAVIVTITKARPTGEPNYTRIITRGKTLDDAALTLDGSTISPADGVLEWVDDAGNVLPGSTRVKANTAYKWRFTPADGNYTTLSGEIELYYKPNGGNQYGTDRTIRASAGANGTISPAGWTSVGEGGEQTFTITPDAGYAVAKVLVDGRSVGAVTSYTFRNVTQDHTIEAVFMKANGNPQTGVTVTRSTTGCGR